MINAYENDRAFRKAHNEELLALLGRLLIRILTELTRGAANVDLTVVFTWDYAIICLRLWVVLERIAKDFIIGLWRCKRAQHERRDGLSELFPLVVSQLLWHLQLFECGCVAPFNFVDTKDARLKEDEDTLKSHRVKCRLNVSRSGWRINRRLDTSSLGVQ